MSGLVSFFQDPSTTNKSYEESTLSLAESGGGIAIGSRDEALEFLPLGHVWTPKKLSFKDWRKVHIDWINTFMNHRLVMRHERKMDTTSPGVNSDLDVPHYSETLHTARHLGDLNLRTSSVDLGTLRVEKIYPFRFTRRLAVSEAHDRHQIQYFCQLKQLGAMSLTPCQHDGPLAVLYPSVLHVEVTQSQSIPPISRTRKKKGPQSNKLRLLATAAMLDTTSTPQVKRLSVYFYGAYAKALRTIFTDIQSDRKKRPGSEIRLELWNVSAVNVVPDSAGVSCDWFNFYDMAPYCLCLGDDSFLQVDGVKHCFDQGLKIRLTWVSPNVILRQWEISKDNEQFVTEIPRSKRARMEEKNNEAKRNRSNNEENPTEESVSKRLKIGIVTTTTTNKPEKSSIMTTTTTTPSSPQAMEVMPVMATHNPEQNRDPPLTHVSPMRQPVEVRPAGPTSPVQHHSTPRDAAIGEISQEQVFEPKEKFSSERSKMECYTYCKLNELGPRLESHDALNKETNSHSHCFVNVYALVIGLNSPSRTRQGDWMMSITLVDDSLEVCKTTIDSNKVGENKNWHIPVIILNVFCPRKGQLPDLRYCGDVIRIHRAKLQKYNGALQLMGAKGAAYLVFRKNDETKSWTASSPSKHCTVAEEEHRRLTDVWNWGQKRIFAHPTLGPEYKVTLADMQKLNDESNLPPYVNDEDKSRDLTVMVTAIVLWNQTQIQCDSAALHPRGFLRVWDGTGGPPSDPHPDEAATFEGDPHPTVIARLCRTVMELRKDRPDLSIPEVVVGRLANVAIWEDSHWELILKSVVPGCFVRLRNVFGSIMPWNKEKRCIMSFSKSHVTPLPDMTFEVVRLIENHDKRLKRKDPVDPNCGVLPPNVSEHSVRLASGNQGVADLQNSKNTSSWVDTSRITSSLAELCDMPGPGMFLGGEVKIVDTIPSLAMEPDLLDSFRRHGALGLKLVQQKLENNNSFTLTVMVEYNDSTPAAVEIKSLLNKTSERQRISHFHQAIQREYLWKARIFCVVFQGCKYFVLDSLQKC